ncbi:cryptochrome/photolyase family protein, partial [Limnohabitans sp.]|uniref:cryptochrome/photolyase family protein n=1 Tax=Limnohabitans sp. TaxID=1907725 RepID=UPI00391B1131
MKRLRRLVLVLGDQLGWDSPALADFDPACDRLLVIEADSEATEVWNHQARLVLFLSGMRHFVQEAGRRGWPCTHCRLDDEQLPAGFAGRLAWALHQWPAQTLQVLEPGALRMQTLIADTARSAGVPLQWVLDTHFLCSRAEFA